MDSILLRTRTSLITLFNVFPLIMASFIGFLAVGLGNLGLFILFIGQMVLVPIAVGLVHVIIDFMYSTNPEALRAFYKTSYAVTGDSTALDSNVTPSYWITQTLFLFGYMIANAVAITALPVDRSVDPVLVSNRNSRSYTIIVTSVIFALFAIALRWNTGGETMYGVIAGVTIGFGLGYGWYQFAATCGTRAADVFGIAQQIIPSSKNQKPMTCVYNPRP